MSAARRALRPLRWLLVAIGISLALPADAYEPVLHEFVPPDDGEDVALAATTADGDLPAAIETRSGLVRAPDTESLPDPQERAYHEALAAGASALYRPDRETRRPNMVHYDDPFTPSIAPYKRLRAFDMVGPDYTLRVRDTSLARVPAGGDARPGEESFYADLVLDFEASSTVLIPSVGPGARVVSQHATPPLPIEVVRDGADNWYARVPPSIKGRARLVMTVAIAREAFGGEIFMSSWGNLAPANPLPPPVARAFAKVEAATGLSRVVSPIETVRRLVAYFRAFVPSETPPTGRDDIYLDLALSQRGVCRHRAFAFLVTALGLGIPTRMVMNEAHAWVEVRSDRGWQRIDLGGAAGAIEGSPEGRPSYEPPPDDFEWPATAEGSSGHQAAERGRQSGGPSGGGASSGNGARSASNGGASNGGASNGGAEDGDSSRSGARSSPRPRAGSAASPEAAGQERSLEAVASPELPRSRVTVEGKDVVVHRGAPLHVAGMVEASGSGCGPLRVDVTLKSKGSGAKIKAGSLTTSSIGAFDGNIFLALSFPVGEYEVVASTSGDARCGAGSSAP